MPDQILTSAGTKTKEGADFGVVRHFNKFSDEYDDSTEWCSEIALIEPLVGRLQSRRILDLGSGTGLIAEASLAHGGRVSGLDLSYPMLQKARERVGSRVVQGEAELLPFRSNSIDVVVCRQLLHYTREAEMLCEVARVIRPGGEFRLAQITSFDDRDFFFWSAFKAVAQPVRRRYYSPSLLRSIVKACCFDVIATQPYCIRRHYTIADIFRRSPLPENERSRFLSWLKKETDALHDVLKPDWNEQGITLNQFWTTLFSIKRDQ